MGKLPRGMRCEWLSFDLKEWTLIGKDMDEYSKELNPDIESIKNVLGETATQHNGFTPSSSIDYIARSEDAIYPHLQKIVNTLSTDEADIRAYVICATLNKEVKDSDTTTLTGEGYQVPVIVVPTSEGGGTSGYTINFDYNEDGSRTQGTVSVTNRVPTFTPETDNASSSDGE